MTVTGVSLAGATPGDFVLGANGFAGAALPPGGSCSVQVSLAPSSPGAKAATLTVADNAAGGLRAVALSGTAVPGAAVPGTAAGPAAAIPGVNVAGTISGRAASPSAAR